MSAITTLFIAALIITAIFGNLVAGGKEDLPISEFVSNYENGIYERIEIRDQKVSGIRK